MRKNNPTALVGCILGSATAIICGTAIVFILASGCSSQNPQPAPASAAPAAEAASTPEQEITGGWSVADAASESVRQAADFAVSEIAKRDATKDATLVRVDRAESQIVAGTNYRLDLVVAVNGAEQTLKAVVWARLDGVMELSSVEP